MATNVQIIFYSMYGHIYTMAEAIAAGVRSVDGCSAAPPPWQAATVHGVRRRTNWP